jgi:drug/metabolite transporter (DMT)-like permease
MTELMNRKKSSYIYAGIAILFWSTSPTAFKIALGELDIMPLITIASITSTLIFFVITIIEKKTTLIWESTAKELLMSAIMGFISPYFYYIVLLRAYQYLPAQVAQPLNMIWPIVLAFLSIPLLGQKVAKESFVALLISFCGVYVISSMGNPLHPGHADIRGVLLATGSSLLCSLYFILNMKDKRDDSVRLFLNFFFASVFFILTLIKTGDWQSSISIKGFAASVYIGIFEIGITLFIWMKALNLAETTDKVSNLVYFGPFISIILIHYIIKEPVYFTTPIGLLLITAGVLYQNSRHVKSR